MSNLYSVQGVDSPLHVFLAVQTYRDLSPLFVHSLWRAQIAFNAANISTTLCLYAENCHVDDGRNFLVREFLESNCTDLVFIDADVGFDGGDLVKLVLLNRDVVAGVYPMRSDEKEYPVNVPPGTTLQAEEDGCVEVAGVPTGFLRIRRHVLMTLYDAAPKFRANNDEPGRMPISIIFERTLTEQGRMGGDYAFCQKWAGFGGKIYVCPEMELAHAGSQTWTGKLGEYWRRAHGVNEARFGKALMRIRAGSEADSDITALCEHWGNIPWAAGAGLVWEWVKIAREAKGPILECGSGLTTLAAAAANPDQTVYVIEHDFVWGSRTRAFAEKYGLTNISIVNTTLKDGWYVVPDGLPKHFAAVLVDGPPRDQGNRFLIAESGITGDVMVWDDIDQKVMESGLERFSKSAGFEFTVINHPTKNFAVCAKAA